jgi:hypothetical protein
MYTLSVVGSIFELLPLSLYRDGTLVPSFDSNTVNDGGDHPIIWGMNPLRRGNCHDLSNACWLVLICCFTMEWV